ncbi:MAG: L-2-amino-thiazoline-4-carboxylic acid hydrolase [Oscillospiraceae bacterium]|nr:L-2-amino-thiazoline-4-carboxylic acid hydrolase [Oscillospiraceae bacterium]
MSNKFEEATKGLYPKAYNDKVRKWLRERYSEEEAENIWSKTVENYLGYLKELPNMGGKKNGHSSAIYGALLIFALYPALPDQPPVEQLQDFVQKLFMEPFTKLGKLFDLNRGRDMWLIDKVFQHCGRRDRRDAKKYPDGFINVSEPYDRERHAARYHFTQCPNAQFAKQHGLLHVLPLMCNCDFYGIGEIHGKLIRLGTCGNGDKCDYLVVGDRSPQAREYESVTDKGGFLVSRKKGVENQDLSAHMSSPENVVRRENGV